MTTNVATGLEQHGIGAAGNVYWNLTTPVLYMHALRRDEGVLAHGGPLVVDTGRHTGRSAEDKFVVREPGSEERIWWGRINQPLDEDHYEGLRRKVLAHLSAGDLYVVDAFAGADPEHRIRLRVVTPMASHALFSRTMFITPSREELKGFEPQAVVFHAPAFEADREEDATRTGTFIALHPTREEVLIGGTYYAGEIKNEHGWGDSGVFNFEGGCYAKVIKLSAEAEPEIFAMTRTFGTLLENVVLDERGTLDLDSEAKTENTRAAYKIERISNALRTKRAGHPANVVFLTADAFAVMPPIAKLNNEQARYHFLSGFTARLAGTEMGVTEPAPTFSPCFGGPFLPQPPAVYAKLLGEKLAQHRPAVWLVNTGWTGGPAGEGHRMPIHATRALLHAALSGRLDDVPCRTDEVFGFAVPVAVPGVESSLLDPRSTWRDPEAYDAKARELAGMFRDNFAKFEDVDADVLAAGPKG